MSPPRGRVSDFHMTSGGAVNIGPQTPRQKLLRLESTSGRPEQVVCLIGNELLTADAAGLSSTSGFAIVAEIVWGVGRGGGELWCDVPCMLTVPAAETFEVTVAMRNRSTGALVTAADVQTQRRIEGSCAFSAAPSRGSAQLTHATTLAAGVNSAIRAIPAFARSVRIVADDPSLVANVMVELSGSTTSAPGAPNIILQPGNAAVPIPGGYVGYVLTSVVATSVHTIWELQV